MRGESEFDIEDPRRTPAPSSSVEPTARKYACQLLSCGLSFDNYEEWHMHEHAAGLVFPLRYDAKPLPPHDIIVYDDRGATVCRWNMDDPIMEGQRGHILAVALLIVTALNEREFLSGRTSESPPMSESPRSTAAQPSSSADPTRVLDISAKGWRALRAALRSVLTDEQSIVLQWRFAHELAKEDEKENQSDKHP